jgi:hypothetical protein
VIPYEPREPQWALHDALEAGQRHVLLVWHRRAGKTLACVQQLLRSALTCEKPEPRFAYIAPLYRQAKAVAWDTYLRPFAQKYLPHAKVLESELAVVLPNGARIQLFGSDNPDSLRGLYLDGVILDEFGQIHPRLRAEILIPALTDRQGWEVVCGTPKGKNAFYDLYERAMIEGSGWLVVLRRASETKLLADSDLDAARREMSKELYEQEFECSWLVASEGTYYARLLLEAEAQGRVTSVPYDPGRLVDTSWDLGIGDATAICFWQRMPASEIRCIDYYEASGQPLSHYAKVLADKGYLYGEHLVPHDAGHRSMHTGKTLVELAATIGLRMRIVPSGSIEEGVEATRRMIPRVFWDREKTKPLRDALLAYTRSFNSRLDSFGDSPLHDWSSHGADATRIMAIEVAFGRPAIGQHPRGEVYALT